ncbi:DMT family transporter [Algicella marina]|uniref:EamA family transporter n=1 Tax=Algicella marina TaxID=2683284 RepID=A0A6P1SWH3_9RHOB|nr:DMT family transporter [Algicella marina]QHQ33693.1 EamA family transporter [Algicella marina]
MHLFFLTFVALVAFAANSLLNRAAFVDAGAGAAGFTALRLASGALILAAIVAWRGSDRGLAKAGSWQSAGALLLYAIAFSFAYLSLDAGLGALILFGGVQITMFAGSLLTGVRPGVWRWIGSGLGLAGLTVLLLPGVDVTGADTRGVLLMLAAAVGWGIYSLRGASAVDPLLVTAGNFWRAAVPAVALFLVLEPFGTLNWHGAILAVMSGALASGCGYAVWYAVLPRLEATTAAVAQLSVPLIATVGGILLLDERPGTSFAVAAVLILGGIVLAVFGPKQTA